MTVSCAANLCCDKMHAAQPLHHPALSHAPVPTHPRRWALHRVHQVRRRLVPVRRRLRQPGLGGAGGGVPGIHAVLHPEAVLPRQLGACVVQAEGSSTTAARLVAAWASRQAARRQAGHGAAPTKGSVKQCRAGRRADKGARPRAPSQAEVAGATVCSQDQVVDLVDGSCVGEAV
jgi:hypothetical protein